MRCALSRLADARRRALRADSEEEAVTIANESEYGLVCGISTGDMARAFRVARRIESSARPR
ncbi:aldehyde dehydrogenase family protein [Kutzneria buriramensis]|uniref:Aldehyde dehydrogenase family protein n=1 Tax=Kutzneria buriramensis TaxID=1045776 RepID=A0A3E0HG15_9PSEU|nr:aldehyde dehydrogenase family protein [Kutzneria buriramensis]REH44649.1 aldehyde dehydrogenase family protein [Kutzneria buriramensis]